VVRTKRSSVTGPQARLLRAGSALHKTYRNWSEHRTIRLGAGLAYYGLFALVPMISLLLFVASSLFSQADIEAFISDHLADTASADLDQAAATLAEQLGTRTTQASLGIIGIVGLVIAASFVFVAVEDALNIIFEWPVGRGTESWFHRRLVAFGVVLLATTIFVAATVLQAVTGFIESLIDADATIVGEIADLFGVLLSATLATVTLTLLLRVMTSSQVPWRYALLGSAVTAIGLALGGWALGVYFSTVGAASLAGAIGGMLALIFFLYYEAQILLAGAELTGVLWHRGALKHDREDQNE